MLNFPRMIFENMMHKVNIMDQEDYYANFIRKGMLYGMLLSNIFQEHEIKNGSQRGEVVFTY